MNNKGMNDSLYNLAAEYGPDDFYRMYGDDFQFCANSQRVWVRAKERWFYWELDSSEETGSGPENSAWGFVGEVRVCFERQPMKSYEAQERAPKPPDEV